MVSSFFCNIRCRDDVYNFLRCQELMRENMALRSAAKDLLVRLKRQEAAVEQLEKEGATKGEEIRVLKRRIEAWLLHGFGSKSV